MQIRPVVAVVVGGVVDIVSTNLLTMPLLIYIGATNDFTGVPREQIGARALALMSESPGIQAAGMFLGLSATVLGGYVSARLARRAEIRYGASSAWLCMASGVYGLVAQPGAAPLWQPALAFMLSPVFAALGGYLRLRQRRRGEGEGGGTMPVVVSA